MTSAIGRIKLIFLGVFVVACALIWGYEALYVWPRDRCEAHGDWWDGHDRVCAVPMPLWEITGRRMTPNTKVIPSKPSPYAAPPSGGQP